MKKALFIMAILVCAFSATAETGIYAGFGVVSDTENGLKNPLGFIGVNYRFGNTEVYGEHLSSFPNRKDKGLNMVGLNALVKVSGAEIYGGLAAHDRVFDSSAKGSGYGQDFPDVFLRAGVRYGWFFGEVLHNRFHSGVRIEF